MKKPRMKGWGKKLWGDKGRQEERKEGWKGRHCVSTEADRRNNSVVTKPSEDYVY